MTAITGAAFIAGQPISSPEGFQAQDPRLNQPLPGLFPENGDQEVAAAAEAAAAAFLPYSQLSDRQRALLLDCIAEQLEQRREAIVARACAETALPELRINGELSRTTGQLQLFANLLRDGSWVRASIDRADPTRQPLAKPDIRLIQQPLGPVAVFGASNFPLAFSVAGGDTASALAAGCPVIVKGHPAHPGTSELVGRAINAAIEACGLPAGVFSLLSGTRHQLGATLVQHPAIQAVGFTGSLGAGRALFDLASRRPQPIPFYGELGSVNPVYLLPAALQQNGAALASEFVQSLNMGCGQFCTNPGLLIAIDSPALEAFQAQAAQLLSKQPARPMLTAAIGRSYRRQLEQLRAHPATRQIGQGQPGDDIQVQTALFKVSADTWLADPMLEEEVFGPCALLVCCRDADQLLAVTRRLQGHLTSTLHGAQANDPLTGQLMALLPHKVGRILFDGWPTGVEVCHSMTHGGPYPAATDSRSSSVGSRAIERWVRPVSYQNTPDPLLPPALQNANPLGIWRQIDGQLSDGVL
ncbi:aldehyde dehydrogenase (NADP(+)) [Marinobacterium arenosum]|uniref:aldehyde dehydrogenase (NADP(+)) n=1 Tax=Marinobacterium arenosum TaxID=2862496 RepID=UPI001C97AF30|nr:aldehyde dehydrogenase (NADP(+)) [Marinobacterium arenosum]MBY4675631.1 aldehyde dehydrogenase (NADP(+)) [Marinobacterium arenosum]